MALIESLRLNKGEQQDAAEFSKLFLDMITNELLKQKDEKLRSLTRDLVRFTLESDIGELTISLRELSNILRNAIAASPANEILPFSNSNSA
jgi:hypothetical protein